MLYQISCDKFNKNFENIKFKEALNVVLGDEKGSNSIGKSTFLMIIDYVFGGDSYLKASDVFSNIGHHCINFAFKFDGVVHYFKRETERSETVWICDANYKPIIEETRKEFCQFLFEQYKVELHQSTFREVTSLFSRVYSKGNLNEKEPLSLFPKEKNPTKFCALRRYLMLMRGLRNKLR